jgi:hypothetical protein
MAAVVDSGCIPVQTALGGKINFHMVLTLRAGNNKMYLWNTFPGQTPKNIFSLGQHWDRLAIPWHLENIAICHLGTLFLQINRIGHNVAAAWRQTSGGRRLHPLTSSTLLLQSTGRSIILSSNTTFSWVGGWWAVWEGFVCIYVVAGLLTRIQTNCGQIQCSPCPKFSITPPYIGCAFPLIYLSLCSGMRACRRLVQ